MNIFLHRKSDVFLTGYNAYTNVISGHNEDMKPTVIITNHKDILALLSLSFHLDLDLGLGLA